MYTKQGKSFRVQRHCSKHMAEDMFEEMCLKFSMFTRRLFGDYASASIIKYGSTTYYKLYFKIALPVQPHDPDTLDVIIQQLVDWTMTDMLLRQTSHNLKTLEQDTTKKYEEYKKASVERLKNINLKLKNNLNENQSVRENSGMPA